MGLAYALTILRRTNGALSVRTKKLAGPFGGKAGEWGGEPLAVTYASEEKRPLAREADPAWTTKRLIERWIWHNDIRSVILITGTMGAALAVALD